MKLVLLSFFVLFSFTPIVFGDLQNTELHAESAVISLDIKFGLDEYQQLFSKTLVHPQLESINLIFYGDEIILTEPELRVVSDGKHFRIISIPEGILIYGHQNKEIGNYKINIYFASSQGLTKFPASTAAPISMFREDKTTNPIDKRSKIIVFDNPTLHVLTSHFERVLEGDSFGFAVKTFDKNMYDGNEWDKFYGKLDGVKVDAKIIDSEGNTKKEFSGYTKYGIFMGEQLVRDILWPTGNYRLELDLSFENQTYSKNLDFKILSESTSFNNRPITNAGDDQHLASGDIVTLSGSDSFDQDDSIIYYTWTQTSGNIVILSSNTAENPTFTIPDEFGTFIFNLSIDDGRKTTSATDSITVTSLHSSPAGPDEETINVVGLIQLDGSASGDALEHDFTYLWTIISVPDDSQIILDTESEQYTEPLSNITIVDPTFDADVIGFYTIELVVEDETGLTDTEIITITVE